MLWLVTSTWLIGCGRVGFGEVDRDPIGGLPDAAMAADAPPPIADAPEVDATGLPAPAGPKLTVGAVPAMTTPCGSVPTPVRFELTNAGDMELVITDLPSDIGGFHLKLKTGEIALPIKLAPGATTELEVLPPAAVIGTDVGGTIKREVATLKSNAVNTPRVDLDLATTVVGANIVVTAPAPPAALAFTDASGNCPLPRNATIRNNGNASVTVQILLPGEFGMSGASSATVAGGTNMTRSFRPLSSGACSGAGPIEYDVTGPSCGPIDLPTFDATFNITGSSSSCICP